MAASLTFRIKADNLPVRYKFNPYFDASRKPERKALQRVLRHRVKEVLNCGR